MNIGTVSSQTPTAVTGYAVSSTSQSATPEKNEDAIASKTSSVEVVISDEAREKLQAESLNDNGGGVEPPKSEPIVTQSDNGGGVEPPKSEPVTTQLDNGGGVEPPKTESKSALSDNGGGVEPPLN